MRDTGFSAKAVVDNGYLWTAGYTRDMKKERLFNVWKVEPPLRGTVVVPSVLEGYENWKCYHVGEGMGEYPELETLILAEGCSIASFSFCDCPKLKTVVLPSTVRSVAYQCFANCPRLKTVYSLAKEFNTTNLLESVPNVEVVQTTLDKLPEELRKVIEAATPTDAAKVKPLKEKKLGRSGAIRKNAYKGKTDLEAVSISDGVTEIGEAAFAYSSVKAVKFPNSLARIGRCAFQRTNLENVTIPGCVMEIDYGAFQDNESLKNVVLEEGVVLLSYSAFSYCPSLVKVALPESLQEIGGEAFEQCTALEEIVVPSGVKRILRRAFAGCTALKTVVLPKTVEEMADDAFEGTTAKIVRK
jgi:hypothetical protein